MITTQDHYYDKFEEPVKGCLIALRQIILDIDPQVEPTIKYGMPFFCYINKMFAYLWVDKKTKEPYIGFVEGKHLEFTELEQGDRSRMKILRIPPSEDIPIELVTTIVLEALDLYKSGVIEVKK